MLSLRRKNRARRFVLESLEGRQLLSTFTVNSAGDDLSGPVAGQVTLRDAITQANKVTGHSDIKFSVSTIALDAPLPVISGDLAINTPTSPHLLIWYGGDIGPVLTVANSATAEIDDLSITGNGHQGIQNAGNLTLKNDVFIICASTGNGGTIYNSGTLNASTSWFYGSQAIQGGAIYNSGALNVTSGGFYNNSASLGGAIYNTGTLTQSGNVFQGNTGGDVYNMPTLTVTTLDDDLGGPIQGQTTLRDAIQQANSDPQNQYTINFAVNGTMNLLTPLPDLKGNISIVGPGASNLKIQGTEPISFNSDGVARNVAYPGGYTIFTNDIGATASISGVTISGNYVSYGNNSYLTFTGVANHGTMTLQNDVFSNDSPQANTPGGGAVYNTGALNINGCTFSNDQAPGPAGHLQYVISGGAIYNSGTVTVSSSNFNNDYAYQDGGAIYNAGTMAVSTCNFNSNASGDHGGVIYNAGNLSVSASQFNNNSASYQGGVIYNANTLTLTTSTFSGNGVGFQGNVIYNGGTATIGQDIITALGNDLYNNGTLKTA